MISENAPPARRFEFGRDTFAYANELVWDYEPGADAQTMITRPGATPRTYTHRCFVMVRSARQFFQHARFDASRPPVDDAAYARLVRTVVSRNPRSTGRDADRIVIPGYDGLHSFSRARSAVLMAQCGGMWQSYVLRSHWRMVFPFSSAYQENMAGQLTRSVARRGAAIIHIFCFPQLTLNHGILLFDAKPTSTGVTFWVYDPNLPAQPGELTYSAADRAFYFPRNHYWAGGRVSVVEAYCSWFY